jgi:hypothetical protein
MENSALSKKRLQEAVKAQGKPLYVLAAEIRAASGSKIKIDPGDLSRIIRGFLLPNLGQKLAIAQVLGKPMDFLWPKDQAHLYPDGMPPEDNKQSQGGRDSEEGRGV